MSINSAVLIALLSILLLGVVVTLGTYLYANSVKKKSESIEKTNLSQDTERSDILPPREESLEKLRLPFINAQQVESDGVLTVSSAVLGIAGLEMFARRRKSDYLVGVNRGGWLLSLYLAHRLEIPHSNILQFNSDTSELTGYEGAAEAILELDETANFLLIDSINKSGQSMSDAVKLVKEKIPQSNFSVAVLVSCGELKSKEIDYFPYWTKLNDIALPWSSDERKERARKAAHVNKADIVYLGDKNSLENTDKKIHVLRMADVEPEPGEWVDIANEDMETIMNIFGFTPHRSAA